MTSGATGHSPRAQDRNLVRKESDLVRKSPTPVKSLRTDHSSGIAETPYAVWHLGEGPSEIDGRMVYLSRVINLEGDILDVFVQSQRNKHAVETYARSSLLPAIFRFSPSFGRDGTDSLPPTLGCRHVGGSPIATREL